MTLGVRTEPENDGFSSAKTLSIAVRLFSNSVREVDRLGQRIRGSFSDLRFTDANRVPLPFMRTVREKFSLCSVVTESKGPRLRDLDGNWSLDVSGSYG